MSQRTALTVRLPGEQLAHLNTVARIDGVAIAEEIREAVTLLLQRRAGDDEFRAKVEQSYREAKELLSQLDDGQELAVALGDPLATVAAIDQGSELEPVAVRMSVPAGAGR